MGQELPQSPFRVATDVWGVAVPVGSPTAIVPYTTCYVLRDQEGVGHLIDPGEASEAGLEALTRGLRELSIDAVDTVTGTHAHPDHIQLAEQIHEQYGARIVMGVEDAADLGEPHGLQEVLQALASWQVPEDQRAQMHETFDWVNDSQLVADFTVDEGDILPISGHSLVVWNSPGHTPGHICLVDTARSVVYTGDQVLKMRNPGIGYGDYGHQNPLRVYLGSLERLRGLGGDYLVAPGHGLPFRGLTERCRAIQQHHLRRAVAISAILEVNPEASVWELASRIRWGGGWENLSGPVRFVALAQTEIHRDFILSGGIDEYHAVCGE